MFGNQPATSRSSDGGRPRLILAFDLDNMYVACERLRDPSLVGKPVGVQQKGLLATSSYEARALGVDKLCSLREAKQRCPSLIIVNGEDLTLYRYYSRRVFNLVRSVLGSSSVEKLGLDELFCDVTELVTEHFAEPVSAADPRGRWFSLAQTDDAAHLDNKGFWYRPEDGCPGHTIPEAMEPARHEQKELSPATMTASCLANHLRHLIMTQIGLGSSAGIAYNKTVAKLVGNLHKPNMQTTLTVSPDDTEAYARVVKELLDPLDARKLMGFGSKVVHTLRDHINESSRKLSSESATSDVQPEPALTVGFLRQNLSSSIFASLLGAQVGPRLWNLLDGKDDEPVKPSPEFPLTISIEDSFDERRGTLNWHGVLREIEILAKSLLRRLEIELVDGGELDDIKKPTTTPSRPRKWQRYPSQIKLTIRTGHSREISYNANRESRSAAFPVPAFDLDTPREDRARALVKQPLSGLAKQILDKGSSKSRNDNYEIFIINIAVTHLETTTPTQAIDGFFASTSAANKPTSTQIGHTPSNGTKRYRTNDVDDLDFDTLQALPADIRAEVLREYGVDTTEWDLGERPHKQSKVGIAEAVARPAPVPEHVVGFGTSIAADERSDDERSDLAHAMDSVASDDDDSTASDSDIQSDVQECTICGASVFPWSLDAHLAYHTGS